MGTLTNSEDPDEMRHLIRIYTICLGINNPQGQKYIIFGKCKPVTP